MVSHNSPNVLMFFYFFFNPFNSQSIILIILLSIAFKFMLFLLQKTILVLDFFLVKNIFLVINLELNF